MNFKNSKLVQKLKSISPRLKWAMFSGFQDYKIGSKYIDYIIPDNTKSINKDNERIENMVRETLIKEFSPEIQKMKSSVIFYHLHLLNDFLHFSPQIFFLLN